MNGENVVFGIVSDERERDQFSDNGTTELVRVPFACLLQLPQKIHCYRGWIFCCDPRGCIAKNAFSHTIVVHERYDTEEGGCQRLEFVEAHFPCGENCMLVIISGLCVASRQEGHLACAIFPEKGAQRAARLDVRPGMNDRERKVTKFVTGSWDEDSSYASWTGVSSGTGLVLYGLIGSRGLS